MARLVNAHTMTQKQIIIEYLHAHGSITQRDAYDFGCFRLASRINDLKKDGHMFSKTMESTISRFTGRVVRYARYRLA